MTSHPKDRSSKAQSVCIDLPGETVQCWRSTDKVQVVLKKHRDLVFDLKLAQGRKYTVESTGSDFYHSDQKKLIAGGGKQRVLFNDGERLHLWVAREFKGELLLKSANELLMRIDPGRLDKKRYDHLPATKPEPIIISVGVPARNIDTNGGKGISKFAEHPGGVPLAQAIRMAAPVEEDCPLVCVVNGSVKDAPAAVWKMIQKGGGNSGLIDLDPFDVATRNWLLGQIAGAAAYIGDNWDWLRESLDRKTHKGFRLISAKIHYVRGQAKYYFSGYSKYNTVFKQGGFGSGHDRIMTIFGGAGKGSTALTSTAKGILGSFKGNAFVAFIFDSATSFAEWKADASKDGCDLFASLLMNVVKTILIAAVVAPVVAAIIALFAFGAKACVVVIAVGALTLGAGFVVSFGVDVVDKKLGKVMMGESHEEGISPILANHIRQNLKGNWDYLKKKLLWDYEEVSF